MLMNTWPAEQTGATSISTASHLHLCLLAGGRSGEGVMFVGGSSPANIVDAHVINR